MIKNIKRVGIIFLVVAIVCLMAIGCLSVNSVTSSGNNVTGSNLSNAQNNISADVEDNEQKESASEEVVIPSADRVYTLTGDCDSMADGWQKAVKESEETGSIVKVILGNNWTAKEETEFTTSFGTGYAFEKGIIVVPVGCNIVLDLAGKTIDRALSEKIEYGRLIDINGTLSIVDSSYDMSKIYAEYDEIVSRATQSDWQERRDFIVDELSKIECGKFLGGYSSAKYGDNDTIGSVIHVNQFATLDIYGGMFYNNKGEFGTIGSQSNSTINIYNILMLANNSKNDASSLYVFGLANLFNGLYVGEQGNNGVLYAAARNDYGTLDGCINIYNSRIEYCVLNMAILVTAPDDAKCNIRYIICKNNIALRVLSFASSNNTFKDGIIANNLATGIYLYDGAKLIISGGVVTGNTKGLTMMKAEDRLIVHAGTQIYGNSNQDIVLEKGQKIEIGGNLASGNRSTYIGVTLKKDYLDEPFTTKYAVSGNENNGNVINPSLYFFANNGKKIVLESNEAKISTEASTATDLTWKWTGGQAVGGSTATVTYTGNPFTITVSNSSNVAQNFYKQGIATAATSFAVTNVGSYAFYSLGDFKNPTFMFTIVPKEVDITWGNETFVYNGNSQVLSAVVTGYPDCVVTIEGAQTNAGSGYMAIATALSDPNLKIRGTRQTKEFSIERAKINAPSGTQTFILDGKEHTYTPTTGWDNTKMAIVDNKATEAGVRKATIMLKDPVNYQWATGGGRHIELEYTIEDKSIIKNNVYDFIYLEQNGDITLRKTYKEGKIYRMANDSDIINNNNDNKLIIGNIAPNTTVFEFMENLKVENNQISIYNGSKAIIENGAIASGINESLLRDKNEMPIGTGWRVVINHENEQAEEIYLSVLGDITGDGKVNTADVNVIRQIVNDKAVFDNIRIEAKLATLILNKGKLATNSDSQLLWEAACGRLDIADFI